MGSVTEIEITVDDLLNINTLSDTDILYFLFFIGEVSNGASLVFDMQFYCIEEIKIPTIDWMGISMTGGGFFMIFCSILMLPMVTFRDIIGRIVGKR